MPVRIPTPLPSLKVSDPSARMLVSEVVPELEVQTQPPVKDRSFRKPVVPPTWLSHRQIVAHALSGGLRSFLLAYGMRGGIAFLIKLVQVLSGRAKFIAALRSFFAKTSLRFASTVGSFSLLWKLINNLLAHHSPRPSKLHGFVAGAVAGGVSILFETKETRVAIAQQFAVRAMQAGYGALKQRGVVNFRHGDGALFMLACASIMYAYIMQPETIPREYYSWMVKIAGMPAANLNFNRLNIRGFSKHQPVANPLDALQKVINAHKGVTFDTSHGGALADFVAKGTPMPIVPCSILHAGVGSCTQYNVALAMQVVKNIMPVYAALNFVPMLLLKTGAFVKNPAAMALRNSLSTLRSTLFLTCFIGIFQGFICVQRNIAQSPIAPHFLQRDYKVWYYVLGGICSSSIFLEQKSRRSELAMYVLPKGLGSLWAVLEGRGKVRGLPHFEVLMASAAMGMLMSVYQTEPQHISSLLFKVMNKVIGRN
ncbi:hypothetical protein HDU86_000970 [Geranomyces michiganensis]|nr:hypothetical protein HDU86_000970 [Geranomyces michiganensis]